MRDIKPFVLGEYDYAFDPETKRSVLIAPTNDGKTGVWFDVPEPIVSNSFAETDFPAPEQVIDISKEKRSRLYIAMDLLSALVNPPPRGYGVGC